MNLRPVEDVSPADWIVESLTTFGTNIGGLVPARFEAYARVFHPAWIGRQDRRNVTWREIAEANGKTPHAGMQFRSILPPAPTETVANDRRAQPGLWTDPPSDGEIPDDVATELARLLSGFTSTSEECYFAYWNGWGDPSSLIAVRKGPFGGLRTRLSLMKDRTVPPSPNSPRAARGRAAHFQTPGRAYYLYRGGIADVNTKWQGSGGSLPTMWWPEDQAWFVHTEIDLDSTYVGASRACIDALLATSALEAMETDLQQSITWDSDHING